MPTPYKPTIQRNSVTQHHANEMKQRKTLQQKNCTPLSTIARKRVNSVRMWQIVRSSFRSKFVTELYSP